MKKLVLAILVLLAGCRTAEELPEPTLQYKEKVVERLVPVKLPDDSSTVKALFECDSLNNVIMRELAEKKGENTSTAYHFNNGKFEIKTLFVHDTVYLKARDSIVYREVPVKVDVIKEVNVLSGWQKLMLKGGELLLLALIAGIVYLFLKLKNKGFKVGLKLAWKWIRNKISS